MRLNVWATANCIMARHQTSIKRWSISVYSLNIAFQDRTTRLFVYLPSSFLFFRAVAAINAWLPATFVIDSAVIFSHGGDVCCARTIDDAIRLQIGFYRRRRRRIYGAIAKRLIDKTVWRHHITERGRPGIGRRWKSRRMSRVADRR